MLIRCRTGGEQVEVPEGQDPHAALDTAGCSHCALGLNADPGHHCGRNPGTCRPLDFMADVTITGLAV